MLFFAVAGFTSCNKDKEVDVFRLEGRWSVKIICPACLTTGDPVYYTFNADKSCEISHYFPLTDTVINTYLTYEISNDNTLITMTNEDGNYIEYRILEYSSTEMNWERTSPEVSGGFNLKFVRTKLLIN